MQRRTIGLLALGLLALGAWLTLRSNGSAGDDAWLAAFARVGAIMAVVWLAYPQLERVPKWTIVPAILLLVLAALRPRILVPVLIVLIVVAVIKPRRRRQQPIKGRPAVHFTQSGPTRRQ